MKYLVLTFIFLSFIASSLADDNLSIKYNAYIDTYIATDNDKQPHPDTIANKYRSFAAVGSLRDEFAINIAQIGVKISYTENIRANVVFQTGSLPDVVYNDNNLNLQQANVGYRIWEKLWVDAGSFMSHIGSESYLPKDNWFQTHSIVTFFEPFYQQGLRIAWEDKKISAGFHLLNGFGILTDSNNNKSVGTHLIFAPSEVFSISYAGIYGNENLEAPKNAQMHMFHNICINLNPSEKIKLKAQFDYSTLSNAIPEENGNSDSTEISFSDGSFMGFSAQARYFMTEKFSAGVRFAYFDNVDNIYPTYKNGIDGMALTASLEFKPTETSYIRFEGSMITINEGEEKAGFPGRIFYDGEEMTNSRIELMLSFGVWYE